MLNILVIILVAGIVTALTSKVKELIDQIIRKELKPALIVSLFMAIVLGVALQIGFAQSILEIFGGNVELTDMFKTVDIGLTCGALWLGSGGIINIVDKFQEDSSGITGGKL